MVGTGLLLTGCSDEETTISAESVELPMPTPTGYEFEHSEEDKYLVDVITADAKVMVYSFISQEDYDESMAGGYWLLLVVSPDIDYNRYIQNSDGSWSHKPGASMAIRGVEDTIYNAIYGGSISYTHTVGYFYIVEEGTGEKE